MNSVLAETVAFTDAEIEETRASVRAIMAAENQSQADIAKATGIPYGTFTGWLGGTYKGRNDKVAAEVHIWLTSREENRRNLSIVPRVPEFQMTPSARRFLDTLNFAQILPEISVIAGGAGIGKTTAAHYYDATHPNVWLCTMDPSTSSVNAMMQEICQVLGVTEKSATKLARAIGAKVQGTDGLIIIDEAQHLSSAALDQLRSLFDRYGVGIALLGNESVYARLEGSTGARANFAQLFSRIGVRVTQLKPKHQDMCTLIAAWGVTDKEEIKFLKAIGSKPGALRGMTKCLQLASMIAAGAQEPRALRHIRAAWEKLSSTAE